MESKIVWQYAKKEDRPEKYKICLLVIKNDDCTDVIVGYWDGERLEIDYGEEVESNVTKVIYWAYMDKKRDSFTFQRYYFEAISTLKSKEKLELYDAICAYVFEEKDATLNSKKAESCFILIKHLLNEEWKRSDIASKGWSTRKSAHPHVINEMKVSSSMSSKSGDDEHIVSTDSQMSVKTLPESAVKKKPDIFSDFAHGDKALLESLREFAQMRTRIKKPMTDRAKQMLCNKLEKFDRHDWKAILDQSIYVGWQDIYALKQDDQYEQSTEMEFPRL